MDYPAERHAFPWILPQKNLPGFRIIHGTTCLSTDYTLERHVFPRYNLQKVLTFRELYPGKASRKNSNFPRIIDGKPNFVHKYLRECAENIKLLLDIHQGPIWCWLVKKTKLKISCYSPFKREQLVSRLTLEGRLTWNDISWDEPRARLWGKLDSDKLIW